MTRRTPFGTSTWILGITTCLAVGLAWSARSPLSKTESGRPAAPQKTEKYRVTHGPDSPDDALRWKQIFERDEHGVIDPAGLMNARRHLDAMRAQQTAQAARGAVPSAAGLSNDGWTWIGPGNIGGRTRGIAIHPTSTATMFAGSVGGGIWKTTNGGATWAVVDDFMANLAVSAIVYRPGDPATMFAGTGEGFFNIDALQGAGVFRSTDGGTTWSQLSSTTGTDFNVVNELAMSPNGNTLLAATGAGIFRSVDLGTSWLQTSSTVGMMDVKFLPGSNTNAVAGTRTRSACSSADGGATWTVSTGMTALGGGVHLRLTRTPRPRLQRLHRVRRDHGIGHPLETADGNIQFREKAPDGLMREVVLEPAVRDRDDRRRRRPVLQHTRPHQHDPDPFQPGVLPHRRNRRQRVSNLAVERPRVERRAVDLLESRWLGSHANAPALVAEETHVHGRHCVAVEHVHAVVALERNLDTAFGGRGG